MYNKIERMINEIDNNIHGQTKTIIKYRYGSKWYIETYNKDEKNGKEYYGRHYSRKYHSFNEMVKIHIEKCNELFVINK